MTERSPSLRHDIILNGPFIFLTFLLAYSSAHAEHCSIQRNLRNANLTLRWWLFSGRCASGYLCTWKTAPSSKNSAVILHWFISCLFFSFGRKWEQVNKRSSRKQKQHCFLIFSSADLRESCLLRFLISKLNETLHQIPLCTLSRKRDHALTRKTTKQFLWNWGQRTNDCAYNRNTSTLEHIKYLRQTSSVCIEKNSLSRGPNSAPRGALQKLLWSHGNRKAVVDHAEVSNFCGFT